MVTDMVSVNAGSARRRRRWPLVVGGVVGGLLLVALVTIGVPLFQFWQQTRPIDHTVAHGDRCLDEPQGENLRCWDIHVPDQLGSEPNALVIDIHGFLNRPSTQQDFSDFATLADEEGFIVAWPYGIRWSWNGGGDPWPSDTDFEERPGIGCCGHALNEGVDDVAFIADLIEAIGGEHPIDPDRIYLSGFSTGCVLAQRVAAEASDLVDGVACMSGYLLVDPAEDYNPVPIAVFNGTSDEVTRYEAGYWPGAIPNFDTWRANNGCVDEPVEIWAEDGHTMLQSSTCTNGARVALVTLDQVGHVTYSGHHGLEVDTTRMAWEFLDEDAE